MNIKIAFVLLMFMGLVVCAQAEYKQPGQKH